MLPQDHPDATVGNAPGAEAPLDAFRVWWRHVLALSALLGAGAIAVAAAACLPARADVAAGLAAGVALSLGKFRLRAWRLERFARLPGEAGVRFLVGARFVDYGLLAAGLLAAALAGANVIALAGGLFLTNLVTVLDATNEARRATRGLTEGGS